MPTMFHDVRLPEDIEQGAVGGPSFLTNVTSISSGSEQRAALWDRPRLSWQLGYGIQNKEDYAEVLAFFYARQGKAYGFRFRDFSDYSALAEAFGTGDGTKRVFRLRKNYASGSTSFPRTITHPVADTLVVYADGVAVDESTYDLEDFGIIRFHSGQAPANAVALTWSGDFDVPVRFDVDDFQLTLSALAAGEVSGNALPVMELREQLNNPPTGVIVTSTLTDLDEDASTATRTAVATFEIVDDDLGVNTYGLTGTDPTLFEAELATDTRSGTLYLKAGVDISHALHTSLSVTVGVWDTVVGDRPSATDTYTLTINEVFHAPVVVLTNEVHALVAGTSTVSRVLLANIATSANLSQVVSVTLTGADASHFELFGGNLYLKATEDTASPHHYLVNIEASDTGGTTVEPFNLAIGVTAGEMVYDTVGTFTLNVPEYNTLTIEVQAPGNASWGYTPGTPTPPTAAGQTYVQNDQTVTLLHRWRVEPFRMTDNPDAWTPGYTIPTAVMNSFGIGAALEDSFAGVSGGVGITPVTKDATFDVASGQGGHTLWDAEVILGGAGVRAVQPPDDNVSSANGLPGAVPGAGASGGVYKKNTLTADQIVPGFGGTVPTPTITFTAMAGAASGMWGKYTWTYGTAQIGAGVDYQAPAPAVGDVLTIKIGAGGVKGSGTVNGADGAHGRARISWS